MPERTYELGGIYAEYWIDQASETYWFKSGPWDVSTALDEWRDATGLKRTAGRIEFTWIVVKDGQVTEAKHYWPGRIRVIKVERDRG